MAVFTYAVKYWVAARCTSPLRSGGADGEAESVLRGPDGTAFLQGSSLSGAMRAWAEERYEETLVQRLFGSPPKADSPPKAGSLIVSDGYFTANSEMQMRPRLRIDGRSGTADQGGKFDVAHMGVGSEFAFALVWLGRAPDSDELEALEELLHQMHCGNIRIGAQKSNGFGRVELKVDKQTFDMALEKDRRAWMMDERRGSALKLEQRQDSKRVAFTLRGFADSILVKGASVKHGKENSCTVNIHENGTAILPGSSVKGAVRARVEQIAKYLNIPNTVVEHAFGRGSRDGDNGLMGQIRFGDVVLDNKKRKITRIRIDRFTGGVVRGGLFTEEPLSSDVELTITAPERCSQACALLIYALRDLGLGTYNLGSGGAVGRGYLDVKEITACAPDGRTGKLSFTQNGGCVSEDPDGLFAGWIEEMEVCRNAN